LGVKILNKPTYYLSKTLIYLGSKVFGASRRIASKIYRPKPTLKDIGWVAFCEAGGEFLRFEYDLKKDSIVFDLGGYDGQFTSDLFSKYESNFYIFEACKSFSDQITERFKLNTKIKVFDFGLSSVDEVVKMSVNSVGSSTYIQSPNMVDIVLKKGVDFINSLQLNCIDLMKINIEGGEYELLAHLIDYKIIEKIDNLQIQFHDFVPNALERMLVLRNLLSLTHYPTYQFDFIWENWKRK
jgi:FkbM family methyltransferase